jgi:branched-chain amino acid transport system permease protein
MTPDQIVLIQSAVNGILIGSLFGVVAMGLSLTWGMLKIANFAHLSFTLLAAYLAYTLIVDYGVAPPVTLLLIAPLHFFIGMGVQWLFVRFRVTTFTSLLLTFGLFMVLENGITYFWSADTISTRAALPDLYRKALRLPPPFDSFFVLPPDLIAFGAALLLGGGIYLLLHYTQWGRGVRAMAADPLMAQAYGVNYQRSALLLAGLATATAGVAGAILAIKTPLFPSITMSWLGVIVAAVILGGLGNPLGAIIATCALVVIQNLWSVQQQPSWAPLIAFSILVLYLIIMPDTLWQQWQARRRRKGVL